MTYSAQEHYLEENEEVRNKLYSDFFLNYKKK